MALVLDGNGSMALGNGYITGLSNAVIPASKIGTGAVLQVVSFNYNGSVGSSSTTLTDSGLTVNITPSSTSSKILVLYNLPLSGGTNNSMVSRTVLLRNTTIVRDISGTFYDSVQYPTYITSVDSCCYLDSPATTSPVTYKVQFCRASYAGSYGGNIYAGYPSGTPVNACQITVMEIAG